MVAIKAHFDGKVIVPDEPVPLLRPQQRLVIHIEPVEPASEATDEATLAKHRANIQTMLGAGLGGPENPDPQFRGVSDDELWGE